LKALRSIKTIDRTNMEHQKNMARRNSGRQAKSLKKYYFISLGLIMLLVIAVLFTVGGRTGDQVAHAMPEYVQMAHPDTQMAYQHAVDYPEELAHQPCYCGCGNLGHKSSLECFVAGTDAEGNPIFDRHGSV